MTDSQIKAEAARWLIELETAEDTAPLWHAFETWLQQNEEHRRAYVRVERAWRTLEDLNHLDSAGTSIPAKTSALKPDTKPARRRALSSLVMIVMIVAAVAAVIAALR